LNKLDLYRRYESLFESIFSTTPPALFTNGKPNAQAARFNVIVNEYGLDEAFWMVEYALENWKELSEILRKTEPPVPGIIVNLRHTLHFWHEKCEDPVHGMREQLKSHKSEAKRDSLTRSEWSQTDEDPGDRLW